MKKSLPPLSWIFDQRYRWIFHVLFWIFIYLDETLSLFGVTSPIEDYLPVFQSLLIDLFLIYFNIYFLLPKFLMKNRFWEYFGWSLLTLILNVLVSIWDFKAPFDFSDPDEVEYFINSFIMSLMATGSILMAAVGIKFFKNYILNQDRLVELETSNLKTELAFLKNQINPHFLFNSLNNIYVQSRKRPKEASESILLLSDLLRYQLYDCAKEKVLLRNEIEYLKNFLQLDKLRKTNSEITFQVNGTPDGMMVAPFIFMPFVENAVKHSMATEEESFVHITFHLQKNKIHFLIENSKPAMPAESEVGGIGLKNVQRRLDLVYPENHVLNIDNQKHTYKINLTLNLVP